LIKHKIYLHKVFIANLHKVFKASITILILIFIIRVANHIFENFLMNISDTKLGKGVYQLEDEMVADLLQLVALELSLKHKLREEIVRRFS